MRKLLIARLAIVPALCALTVAASAGDLSSYGEETPNWSGFYLGMYAGGAWGDVDLRTNTGAVTSSSYFQFPENTASINETGSGSLTSDAAIAGVQIGFNRQEASWVFGLEADYGAFNLHGSRGAVDVPYPALGSMPFKYTARAEMDTDWLATARARVGWLARPNLLVYATAGLAMTKLRVSNSFSDDAPEQGVGGSSHNDIRTGWTLGGGAEWALSRKWSFKAEYLYLDFGSVSTSGSITCGPGGVAICTFFNVTPSPYSTSADLSAHIARVGLNYKF